ncbi:MAG: hypothetical protein A2X18_14530 [Bacteroidetes bacterium GWF2_40_14]|nr:MAG: hypothetical protein A2X18_14530 [Bacteroidetes bacterium GWF2_40_14]
MTLHFSVPYITDFGQQMFMTGSVQELFSFDTKNGIPLTFRDNEWTCTLEKEELVSFEYSYQLINQDGSIEFEAGPARKFIYSPKYNEYFIKDEWKQFSDESPFLSMAFKNVLYFNSGHSLNEAGDITIRLSANNIAINSDIAICGDCPFLGNWQPELSKKMHLNSDGFWEIIFNKNEIPEEIEYRFIQVVNDTDVKYRWEGGTNRKTSIPHLDSCSSLIINHFSINMAAVKARIAGTAVPVFSLRSDDSCGIGDFLDLKKMIDFLKVTGQNVLQLLPVNDTTMTHTWHDSYPYEAISIYALHPIYINPEAVGKISDGEFLKSFYCKVSRLNKLEKTDYDAVEKIKWSYLKKIFEQEGDKTLESEGYKLFFDHNSYWLEPYSAFCFLRDKYKTAEFKNWPEYSVYCDEEIKNLPNESGNTFRSVSLHRFVQYHLHKQLLSVHDYARQNKIILKGDIPIGVNRNSVETWVEPSLFNFSGQAGAPPDDFSDKGQNWGFPTYDWVKMEADGYSWWKRRFRKMAEYFDAYRIDHILGFFRIWEIPEDSIEGVMGHFNPSLPLSSYEIQSMGYMFDNNRDCKPNIQESVLDKYFGINKDKIKTLFLDFTERDKYELKESFCSQRKIEDYFLANPVSDLKVFKEGLLSLCSELLFLKDPIDQSKYHPRISAQFTESYRAMDNNQKECFNSIYNHYYYHRNDFLWFHTAMNRLPPLISATGMLVCGEDLGMIPSCVPSLMQSLRIMSLEIQRMPKAPEEKFANTSKYPYLSVCSTGTHDTSTLRAWWEEDYDSSKRYFKEVLGEEGIAPVSCEPWLCRKIIELHLNSPSMLAIFPLQDWLSVSGRSRRFNPNDERINVPSNPRHYWRYRMHLSIEALLKNEELIKNIRTMVKSSGRVF